MKEVAVIDIETKDPNLKRAGAGSVTHNGFIIGVGIYVPSRNIHGFYKVDEHIVKDVLLDETLDKVAHNAPYDFDWLVNGYNFTVRGKIHDTITRETLLDAYQRTYNLDDCCERHGILGKNKADTIDAYWHGKGKAIEHLDEIPFALVGKYCNQDTKACYDLFMWQQPRLEEQGLLLQADIEARLYGWLLVTRKNGLRIDAKKLQVVSHDLNKELREKEDYFYNKYGNININSSAQLAKLFKEYNLPIYTTEKGNPSFLHKYLVKYDHEIPKCIINIKDLHKVLDTYIDGQFVELQYNGRIYPTLYPSKSDEGGTVTGRFSSAHPNGQNIPSSTMIRELFIPEDDCMLGAFDYKQIEYRIYIHYASTIRPMLRGIQETLDKFKEQDVDYHYMVQEMMGWVFDDKEKMKIYRHITKNLNFGSIYGLGVRSMARDFSEPILMAHPEIDRSQLLPLCKVIQQEYYNKIPFIRPTNDRIISTARSKGYITGISGRRCRLPAEDNRAFTLVNYLVQGTAADLFKKAMVDAWEAGVFNVLTSHIMVHDEIVFSLPQTKEGVEAAQELEQCMKNAYKFNVPIGVDTEIGYDWGHCNNDNWEALKRRA